MGKRWRSGWELVIEDTAPAALMNALSEENICFYGTQPIDEVTLYLQVPYKGIGTVRRVVERRGGTLRMCRPFGLRPRLRQLEKRCMLLVSAVLWMGLLFVANLFVWRIDVTGNESVPTGKVIRAVTEAGAGIGSFWPGFDGEQLKTDLLLKLPEVQWVGVNYHSGAIEVVVRERRKTPEVLDLDEPFHIVAERAGVITDISAKLGQSQVSVGDTVEKGQVLISGKAKSTIGTTRTLHALGTAEARTWYAVTARQPGIEIVKRYTGKKSLKLSLIFGSKRLNFYPGSSILGDTCDKIIMDYHLCVDGVFALPIRVVVQQCEYWTARERELSTQVQESTAQQALMKTLKQRLGETGSVVTADFAAVSGTDGMTVTVMAECLEEIGAEIPISREELRQIQMENTLGDETTND